MLKVHPRKPVQHHMCGVGIALRHYSLLVTLLFIINPLSYRKNKSFFLERHINKICWAPQVSKEFWYNYMWFCPISVLDCARHPQQRNIIEQHKSFRSRCCDYWTTWWCKRVQMNPPNNTMQADRRSNRPKHPVSTPSKHLFCLWVVFIPFLQIKHLILMILEKLFLKIGPFVSEEPSYCFGSKI